MAFLREFFLSGSAPDSVFPHPGDQEFSITDS